MEENREFKKNGRAFATDLLNDDEYEYSCAEETRAFLQVLDDQQIHGSSGPDPFAFHSAGRQATAAETSLETAAAKTCPSHIRQPIKYSASSAWLSTFYCCKNPQDLRAYFCAY